MRCGPRLVGGELRSDRISVRGTDDKLVAAGEMRSDRSSGTAVRGADGELVAGTGGATTGTPTGGVATMFRDSTRFGISSSVSSAGPSAPRRRLRAGR